MIINITEYLANSLLTIFSMDLSYFESTIPVTVDIVGIMQSVGWALMLGNLVFQASKTMMTGLGFDGEDPRTLFTRTFVMSFFLAVSRQVCDVGLGITKTVIELLEVPTIVQVPQINESSFSVPGDASWLLVIIIGIILVVQIIKLFFEIGERYVIVAILTILSPLAFGISGSKNTSDIFKGWVRMFSSMCLMMVLSIVFLKFVLSAMSVVPTGVDIVPWAVFVVAIAKTGRKVDNIILKIGLNPATTGDALGYSRMPGMLSYMVAKNMMRNVSSNVATGSEKTGRTASGIPVLTGYGSSEIKPIRPPIGSVSSVPAHTSEAGITGARTTSTSKLPAYTGGTGDFKGYEKTSMPAGISMETVTKGTSDSSISEAGKPSTTKHTSTRPPVAHFDKVNIGSGEHKGYASAFDKKNSGKGIEKTAITPSAKTSEAGKATTPIAKLPTARTLTNLEQLKAIQNSSQSTRQQQAAQHNFNNPVRSMALAKGSSIKPRDEIPKPAKVTLNSSDVKNRQKKAELHGDGQKISSGTLNNNQGHTINNGTSKSLVHNTGSSASSGKNTALYSGTGAGINNPHNINKPMGVANQKSGLNQNNISKIPSRPDLSSISHSTSNKIPGITDVSTSKNNINKQIPHVSSNESSDKKDKQQTIKGNQTTNSSKDTTQTQSSNNTAILNNQNKRVMTPAAKQNRPTLTPLKDLKKIDKINTENGINQKPKNNSAMNQFHSKQREQIPPRKYHNKNNYGKKEE